MSKYAKSMVQMEETIGLDIRQSSIKSTWIEIVNLIWRNKTFSNSMKNHCKTSVAAIPFITLSVEIRVDIPEDWENHEKAECFIGHSIDLGPIAATRAFP